MPVVPVAIHGSQGVRSWKKLSFPKITVQYGEPITFERVEHPSREAQQEAADEIFDRVKAMYSRLEREGRSSVVRSIRRGGAAAADRLVDSSAGRRYS